MLLLAVREVQVPLLSAMLLGGCVAKLFRSVRMGSMEAGFGPTALFPLRVRRPVGITMCAIEFGLGAGLIATAGRFGAGWPANAIRLGAAVLFLVATCALLELRDSRPDVGCGCFGEFSTAPVSLRTIARAALLAVGGVATIRLKPLMIPRGGADLILLLAVLVAELAVLGALSPELGEALVRLGYSEPCELRVLPEETTLASLRRSAQWRKHAPEVTSDVPVDVWRELCWRYAAFASRTGGRDTEIIFAVYLRPRRPAVHSALVDAVTGEPVAWPLPAAVPAWRRWLPSAAWTSKRVRTGLFRPATRSASTVSPVSTPPSVSTAPSLRAGPAVTTGPHSHVAPRSRAGSRALARRAALTRPGDFARLGRRAALTMRLRARGLRRGGAAPDYAPLLAGPVTPAEPPAPDLDMLPAPSGAAAARSQGGH
jgi:hypothetical protein